MPRITALVFALLILCLPLPPSATARPNVQAASWILIDDETGVILDEHLSHQRTAMASLTKVMTGLVAFERGDLNQQVTIVESDLIGEATAGLANGDQLSLRVLLYGLLMRSGNDAAMAIARAVGGSPANDDPAARERFVGWMNERARSLGLTDTHFTNPHGLDQDGHYSTAYDLALITRAAIRNPLFPPPFGAETFEDGEWQFSHGNQLPQRYPGVLGGKTGWTNDAGLCLIEVADRVGRRTIMVHLGSTFARWYDDAADLLDYAWTLPRPATTVDRAENAFIWWAARTDEPIDRHLVHRSWVWGRSVRVGPEYERYAEAAGGQRLVQYFDKGRMEINDPLATIASGWYVTGGRLAWELITGQRQIGDNAFEDLAPARVPLAGDIDGPSPTYASLRSLLNASPTPTGLPISGRLWPNGTVSIDSAMLRYGVTAGSPLPTTNHGVASVFQPFLDQTGPMLLDGLIVDGPVFSPAFAITGYPITEPYWVEAEVRGLRQDVLVQCFERRCLTYTPRNPAEWRVEMGNIGLHYVEWLEQAREAQYPDQGQQYS